ncbi:carbohydrate-binding protein [Mucilaginibacter arboris]|uniref:hypothetical protein n=1 Tax=Mucilaginibacter arboris TaxID=2682090 RepID=UPI001E4B5761|nr:hypothetical protein [Mucilaginibacter arboris]
MLYLHVFNWPEDGNLILGGLKSNISKACLLADPVKKALTFKRADPLDINIRVPSKAPDSVDAVVVLETRGEIQTDQSRLLSGTGPANRLLAFDAELIGKGFSFGDGKAGKYYVDGWKKTNQTIKWNVRLAKAATYKVVLKYVADNAHEGSFELRLDGLIKKGEIASIPKGEEITEQELGRIALKAGLYPLTITPLEIRKAGLMKILEVQLIPSNSK